MARKKAGLGRGLAELLGEPRPVAKVQDGANSPGEQGAPVAGESGVLQQLGSRDGRAGGQQSGSVVMELSVAAIRPNPLQPRRIFDRESLEELARSIENVGIVQPVIVRRVGGEYELIAGERRWRAARLAGFTVIPAITRSASDVESLELALIENVVRQQLNPIEEAYALQVLLDDLGVTQETLAARVGKSRPAITNKIRLLELPAQVQDMVSNGSLFEGHGRALLALGSRGVQIKLARKAAREGYSVRKVEAAVRRLQEDKATGDADHTTPRMSEEVLEEALVAFSDVLEVTPRISRTQKGVRVEFVLGDEEELVALVGRLLRTH